MQPTFDHSSSNYVEIHRKFLKPPSPTLAVHQDMAQKISRKEEVFSLGFGGNPLPVPECLEKSYKEHIGNNYYPSVAGIPELREAISNYYQKHYGLVLPPSGIFIFPGSKEALFQIQKVLKGDLLLPRGSWVSYAPQALILNKKVHWLPTNPAEDYKLDPEVLERFCITNKDSQKLLILNSPNNPIGYVYNKKELKNLSSVCKRQKIITIFDSIYGHWEDYDDLPYETLAHFCPSQTIITGGLSKVFSGGGWRLGFLAIPRELDPQGELGRALSFLMSETISGVNVPLQFAAVEAYRGGEEVREYLGLSKKIFKFATRYMWQRLVHMGLHCPKPQGGFYVFPSFIPFKDRLNKRGIFTSEELNQILRQENIYVLCGEDFGVPGSQLGFRMAAVDFDGPWVFDQVRKNPSVFSDPLKLMPKLVQACDRLEKIVESF